MADVIFDPIPISYQGLFADQHLVDAQQFGRSLVGVSKMANSVCHDLLFDRVTHDPRKYQVRFCVGPSKENGLLQEIFAVVVLGLPLFTPLVLKVGSVFVEQMIKAMISKVLNKPSDTSKALDVISQVAAQNAELSRSMHEGHLQDKDRLFGLVDHLVKENRRSLRELPEPVGRTVRSMLIGRKDPIVIDEAVAEVLRSTTGALELGDTVEYDVEVVGVFKNNGVCRLKLLGEDRVVLGKISDPALDEPNNIYTNALHAGGVLHVVGKPTIKDGKLHKLFVISATTPEGPLSLAEAEPVLA